MSRNIKRGKSNVATKKITFLRNLKKLIGPLRGIYSFAIIFFGTALLLLSALLLLEFKDMEKAIIPPRSIPTVSSLIEIRNKGSVMIIN
jgi:hypothetical protein